MCGISGILSLCKNTNNILNITKSMNNSLSHRGPDSHGIWNSFSIINDLNGDGLDDLLIGSSMNATGGQFAGKVFVMTACEQ